MPKIIEAYRAEALLGEKIIDFIPATKVSTKPGVTHGNISVAEVFDRWQVFWRGKRVPFLLLDEGEGLKSIWKRLEADDGEAKHEICTEEWLVARGYPEPIPVLESPPAKEP